MVQDLYSKYFAQYDGEFLGFKSLIDQYLTQVPDYPVLDGYTTHNLDKNGKSSNLLITWNENMNSYDWTLETHNIE